MNNDLVMDALAGLLGPDAVEGVTHTLLRSDEVRAAAFSVLANRGGDVRFTPEFGANEATDALIRAFAQILAGSVPGGSEPAAVALFEGARGTLQMGRALNRIDGLADVSNTPGARDPIALHAARAALAVKRQEGDTLAVDDVAGELAEATQREVAAFRSYLQTLEPTKVDPALRVALGCDDDLWWFMRAEPRIENGDPVPLPWRVDVPDGEGWPPGLVGLAVPRLSLELARFLAARDFRPMATDFLEAEADREVERTKQPTFTDGLAVPLLQSWFSVPPQAFAALALVAWPTVKAEVEARKRLRYPQATTLLTLANRVARSDVSLAFVDPDLFAKIKASGALETVEAEAVWRALPQIAQHAANGKGNTVTLFTNADGLITANLTTNRRTEVEVHGSWSVLADYLKCSGGSGRAAVRAALRAWSAFPYQWHADERGACGVSGVTTLVIDLAERPDGVSFALPKLAWPGFARELSALRDSDRAARWQIPVADTRPPTTNPRLGSKPAWLEVAMLGWLRDHVEMLTPDGGLVPVEQLADDVGLSTAKQRTRRLSALRNLLDLWVESGRWKRTGDLLRPAAGWDGASGIWQAKEQHEAGKAAGEASRGRKRPKGRAKAGGGGATS